MPQFCILPSLVQSSTGPGKDCSCIAFRAEPKCTAFWTTALTSIINDMDILLGNQSLGSKSSLYFSSRSQSFCSNNSHHHTCTDRCVLQQVPRIREKALLDPRVLTSNTLIRIAFRTVGEIETGGGRMQESRYDSTNQINEAPV